MRRACAAAALLLAASPAAAQDAPRFCPNRPSLGTSTCTTDLGRALAEMSGVDWERQDGDGERTDTLLFGDLALRTGVGPRTEVQLGFTPLARQRVRAADGSVDLVTGVGDVRLGLRQNVRHPDGEGVSIALEGFVTLPTGARGIGRGDWSAGVVLPVNVALGDWSLGFTGEVDAETDELRSGHHTAASATFGLGRDLGRTLTAVVELAARRDADPDDTHTEWVSAASLAWQVRETAQLDLLVAAGLDRDAPDLRIVVGGATLF